MTKVTNLTVAALLVAVALPLTAGAQAKKPVRKQQRQSLHDEFTGQGYGMAGCGLGSVAFGPKPGIIQVVAATLNGIAGNQTFGITTGTSNCDVSEASQQAAMFIEVNRETLAKEAARGQGETIAGLASLMNCSDPATFGQGIQSNYEKIFTTHDSYQTTREILSTIEANPTLKASCKAQG